MNLYKGFKYLIVIVLIPFFCNSQNSDFINDSIKSVQLYQEAILLYKKRFYTKSLDTFNESLNLKKKIFGSKNKNLASVYVGIGRTYRNLGQFDLALQNYQLAETNYALAKTYPYAQVANIYIDIGNVYRSKLNYIKALQYFEQALFIYKNELAASPQEIAGLNYSIADIYYITNQNEKAIEITNSNFKNAFPDDQILYYDLLASVYQVEGDIRKSKENFENAINLTIELYMENYVNIAVSYLKYSGFLISVDQFDEAEKILNKAFTYIQKSNIINGVLISDYFKNSGLIAENKPVSTQDLGSFKNQKKQNISEAINFYKKGLAALNFPENYNIEIANETTNWISLINCIELLKLVADNYSELANLEQLKDATSLTESMLQAIKTYSLIGALIQRARKEISDDESKVQLTVLEYSTFQQIVKTCYSAYSVTGDNQYLELAFENAERIKSSSVFEKITDQFALENSLVPDSILILERNLNSTITIFSEKLYEENSKPNPDSTLVKEYNREIFDASRDREDLNRLMESKYNDFYELKYSNSMLSAKEIQKKLKRDQIIIEYVFNNSVSASELYSFVISSEKLDFIKLDINPEISGTIEKTFNFISNTEYLFTKKEDARQFCINSHELYKNLVFPFNELIKDKNIIIIPDGKLSY